MQMKSVEKYRIMGIDPGTNYMGYGVLEIEGRSVRSVVLGDIDLHKLPDPYAKLRYIFERVERWSTSTPRAKWRWSRRSSARTCSRCSSWDGRRAWPWPQR